jgi:hypothetical protein
MNLRKILYQPTLEQKKQIFIETQRIMKKCSEVAAIERKEQEESQRTHDSKCPRCRGGDIVDRFALVESIVNAIETKPVNHCKNCDHEWLKFKMKSVTVLSVMRVILKYLNDIIINPELSKRYSWKLEAIEIFKGYHAEAVYAVQKQYKKQGRTSLSMTQLRTKYESIFDKKRNHEKGK